jgi:hypothetical protein
MAGHWWWWFWDTGSICGILAWVTVLSRRRLFPAPRAHA